MNRIRRLFHHTHRAEIIDVKSNKYWYNSECILCGDKIMLRKDNPKGRWITEADMMKELFSGMDDALDDVIGGVMIMIAIIVWALVLFGEKK
jgi:hypothetical protein